MEDIIAECPVHKKPCILTVGELEQCCDTSIPALVWTCPHECGFRRFEPISTPTPKDLNETP